MKTFDEIRIGDSEEIRREIKESDVNAFVNLTGDNNPLHVDDKFAKKTSFKKRVVHGMLISSFISTIIGTKLPGTGALWLSQSLEFISPVRIGDTIKIKAEVVHKSQSQKVITLAITIIDDNGSLIQRGQARVRLLEIGNKNKKEKLEPKKVNEQKISSEKVAIITGSSRGIGRSIAIKLSKLGFRVIINCKSDLHGAKEVVKSIEKNKGLAYLIKADVSQESECSYLVSETIKKFGRIDVLVNNASGNINSSNLEMQDWSQIVADLNIQVGSAFHLSKLVFPYMSDNKFGRIINIGSIETEGVPTSGWYSYNISKSSLKSLTKSLALELGPSGINVNTISPGMTDTEFISNIPEKSRLIYKMQTPLRRLAEPEDIAETVAFLCSDSSSYITGENIRVCGGKVMQ